MKNINEKIVHFSNVKHIKRVAALIIIKVSKCVWTEEEKLRMGTQKMESSGGE